MSDPFGSGSFSFQYCLEFEYEVKHETMDNRLMERKEFFNEDSTNKSLTYAVPTPSRGNPYWYESRCFVLPCPNLNQKVILFSFVCKRRKLCCIYVTGPTGVDQGVHYNPRVKGEVILLFRCIKGFRKESFNLLRF